METFVMASAGALQIILALVLIALVVIGFVIVGLLAKMAEPKPKRTIGSVLDQIEMYWIRNHLVPDELNNFRSRLLEEDRGFLVRQVGNLQLNVSQMKALTNCRYMERGDLGDDHAVVFDLWNELFTGRSDK